VKTSYKGIFATVRVSTDQKVWGSNPYGRTRGFERKTTGALILYQAIGMDKLFE
jgi:hypothetical protein